MNHQKHSYLMIGLLAVGAALFFTGVNGGALFFLWPLLCMGMMFAMMWGMGRSQQQQPPTHTHDDADRTTHSHH